MRPISPSPHLSRLAIAALATCWAPLAAAQVAVLDKIGNTTGGLATTLGAGDFFGQEVTGIGDLDDDGIEDIAVGAFRDDDGAPNAGAIYVILMNFDGSVKAEQKISATSGGFLGDAVTGDQLAAFDEFGISVAALGDYDGDGNTELAVGAPGDDANTGAVWVLYLNDNGTVKSNKTRRITQLVPWSPTPGARFGTSVAGIGDIDTNFVGDLAVGAPSDSASGQSKGAVYIIPMFSNGTPDFSSQISEGLGGFTGQLDFDSFGAAVCDLGVNHIVVGAPADDDGGSNTGAIYVLEHNLSGTVQSFTKISQTSGGFSSQLDDFGFFGFSIEEIRTGISDNAPDLLVGAPLSNDGGTSQGAMWILFMDFSENLRGEVKISATTGGFTGTIDPGDKFGSGVAAADINLDGIDEIFVGMPDEFAGGADESGAVWALDIDCIDDARELIRNSALAPNPFNFNGGVSGPPMIGQNWDPFVTPVLPVATSFDFVIVDTRAPIDVPNFLGWGTLLCQIPHAGQQFVNAQHGQPFSIPIPNDCSLVGVTACTQAGTFDTTTGQITLWNAIDIRIGTIDL